MRALVILGFAMASSGSALAASDACSTDDGRPRRFRGAPIDLDVKNADIHDVYRLLGDVGRVNIVVPDDIKAKVTLRLKRVPWDQVACTVAAVHNLVIGVNGNVYLITKRQPPSKDSR